MDLSTVHGIYFLGIGGIGMSALARYFMWIGKEIHGYDKTPSELTDALMQEGMHVTFDDSAAGLPTDIDLVIYTPAIPKSSTLFTHFQNSSLPMLKRAEILGLLARNHKLIAIAGTHGKTSVTAMLSHIFKVAKQDFIALPGGLSTNYNTNFIHHGQPQWMIAEADEYDRSFLHLDPDIAVITSIDADHLDVYGTHDAMRRSFLDFAAKVKKGGRLIVKNTSSIREQLEQDYFTYGLTGEADYSAIEIAVSEGKYNCWFQSNRGELSVSFGWAGRHNLENALAATAAALSAGLDPDRISAALQSFKGVKRRFEIIHSSPDCVYIDDYAHHPEELRTCIESVRELYPGRKITGIFQPHLFSRTRDLADDFAKSLDLLDKAVVMEIYPARELPIDGINGRFLFDKLLLSEKYLVPDNMLLEFVDNNRFEVLLTLGAGNIDRFVSPIKKILEK